MADATVSSPPPRRPRWWLRAIAWVVGVLVVLVIVAYFVATSSAFFKGVILPKVSQALNATVTVSDASISPFSQVVLRDLKVQTTGSEPLVSAPEVRLRYSLMDIIGGHINVDEVSLSSPTVVLVQNPDGTSNLDPILHSQTNKPPTPKPSAPSKPMQIDINKVALTDATVRQVKLYKGNNRDVTELSHVNLTVDNLRNGQSAKLALAADISIQNNPPPPATNGLLQAKLNGNFTLSLTPDLKPGAIQGNTKLAVARAEGSLAQVAGLGANLDCDITPTDIKQVALRFEKAGTPLGQLRASGPFNMEKTEGRVTVEVLNIDKNLLNIAGASSGLDFGPTTINSTNTIELANAGNSITTAGGLDLAHFQLTRTNETTPPLDLAAQYDVSVDRAANNALIRTFTLNGTQKGNQLLHGELTSPMTVSWGNSSNPVGDSALNLAITHLDLADWKPFVGQFAPAGDVNMKLQLLSQQAGKQLSFDLSSAINNLTAVAGNNQLTQAAVTLRVKGKASNFQQFDLTDYEFGVARQNESLVTVSGAGTYDQANNSADLQLKGQVLLARLLQAFPQPGMSASSGSLNLNAHVTQKQQQRDVSGSLALTDFTGQFGSNSFQSFGVTSDLDLGMTPDQVQIRKIAGKLVQGNNTGGSFNLSGSYGLSNQTAQLTAKLTDFNQNGLRPFLEPMLTGKRLVSVALNGDASVQYDPAAASAVKGTLQVTNLVVNDPTGQFPATPLGANCQLDASLNKKVMDIRQCQLGLTPTARATNSVDLTGHVDMTDTNATQGNLKLAADSIDLTRYYDLFVGQQKPAPTPRRQPQPQAHPAASTAAAGPQTNQLPLRHFTADVTVHHLYLREVDISDVQANTKIDGGHIVLDPCKLALNGAPMDATVDLDMGVPGYKYGLTFGANAVPLAPLVNSFEPDRKGQIGGTFSAQAKINGVGTDGASLQKTLAGNFDLTSTNLNLSVINIKSPILKTIINVVATIPELLKNPETTVSSLLGSLTGKSSSGGSLTDELSKSPINAIIARGNAGSGKVNLEQAMVQSSAFQADVTGTITLAPVLTNSAIQMPVTVSLSQSIAQRLNMVPAGTPTNAAYAKLPDFLTITGTEGDPKTQINKLALLSLAGRSIGGAIPGVGSAGNLIKGLSGALGGNAGASTNAPNSSSNGVGGLLRGLGGLLGGNAPANTTTNTPPATNQPPPAQQPLNNLLNDLFKKK